MDKIPHIKQSALISVEMGTPMIHRLGELYMNLIAGRSKEDLEDMAKRIQEKSALEPWMENASTVLVLLQNIYKEAEKSGNIEMKEIEIS